MTDEAVKVLAEIAKETAQKVERLKIIEPVIVSLRELGIKVPELNVYNLHWFRVDIDDKMDFRKVREVVGPLQSYDMDPVSKDSTNEIWVTLTPKCNDLRFNFLFRYKKILPEGSKCTVVEETLTRRKVLCKT